MWKQRRQRHNKSGHPWPLKSVEFDAQREFNGSDLFGPPSVVLSFFLGRFMAVQSRKSVIGQKRSVRVRAAKNGKVQRVRRNRRARAVNDGDQIGKLVPCPNAARLAMLVDFTKQTTCINLYSCRFNILDGRSSALITIVGQGLTLLWD